MATVVASNALGGQGVTSLTYQVDGGSGKNTYIRVTTAGFDEANDQIPSGVTYKGIPLKRIALYQVGTDALTMWGLVGSANGLNDVVVTFPAAASEVMSGAITLENVDQKIPSGTVFTNTGTTATPTVDVPGSSIGDVVTDQAFFEEATAGAGAAGAGQTERFEAQTRGAGDPLWKGFGSSEDGNGGTVTMSWTNAIQPTTWHTIAAAVRNARIEPFDYSEFPKHKIRAAVLRGEM